VVGSPLAGRVVIVDDVITAGTAIRESIELILQAGAEPVAVALALDREERGQAERSAVQEVEALYGLRCITLLTLSELIEALEARTEITAGPSSAPSAEQLAAMRRYRLKYGVTTT
jgi:orotate phosphoribosyltransferase